MLLWLQPEKRGSAKSGGRMDRLFFSCRLRACAPWMWGFLLEWGYFFFSNEKKKKKKRRKDSTRRGGAAEGQKLPFMCWLKLWKWADVWKPPAGCRSSSYCCSAHAASACKCTNRSLFVYENQQRNTNLTSLRTHTHTHTLLSLHETDRALWSSQRLAWDQVAQSLDIWCLPPISWPVWAGSNFQSLLPFKCLLFFFFFKGVHYLMHFTFLYYQAFIACREISDEQNITPKKLGFFFGFNVCVSVSQTASSDSVPWTATQPRSSSGKQRSLEETQTQCSSTSSM